MSSKVAMCPREPSLLSHQICSQIFPDSPLKSDQTEFTYSTTDDYGKKMHQLLFCKPKEGFSSHYFENMKEVSAIEGFELVASDTVHCCRDPKLRACDGMILEPTWHDNIFKAIGRLEKRNQHLKNHSSVLTEHASFCGIHIGAVALSRLHRFAQEGFEKDNLRKSRLYFEGGDVLHLTNKEGAPQFIIGEDVAVVTHQTLRMKKWFDPIQVGAEVYLEEVKGFTKPRNSINQFYINNAIPEKLCDLDKEHRKLPDDKILATLQEMHFMGLLTGVKFTEEKDKEKGRVLAAEYLAQIEFVRTRLFPSELVNKADHIHFFPQLAYHNDLAMAGGPKGSICLQDYDESARVLQTIKAKSQELALTSEDLEHLDSFIETTTQVGNDLKSLFDAAKKSFEKAGIPVIPTPFAFYSYLKDKPFNINFSNRVAFFSEKTGRFVSIVPGTKTEGKLADVFMDFHVEHQRSIGNNTAIYFAGRDPNNAQDFTEAVNIMNGDEQQIGPHCLSFELKISPHQTKIT